MVQIQPFGNAREALDCGFLEGTEDKKNGIKPEDVARELREPFQWRRGPGSPFYQEWRKGYEAGYRCLEKPEL